MRTAVISDLHLGSASGRDVLRHREPRDRLAAVLEEADRIVVLGDLLELREQPLRRALADAEPALDALARAARGKPLVLVPGNHDHHLAAPWLDGMRLDGRALALEQQLTPTAGGPLGWVAERLGGAEVTLAYPGLWLRDDVYAIHGHYLDMHLTIPRLEAVAASAMRRVALGGERAPSSPDDYEAALGPLYELLYGMAQGASAAALRRGGGLSRSVWHSLNGAGPRLRGAMLARVALPGGVAALNRAGLGPYRPHVSGVELRESGLRAMSAVVRALGVEADHVLFGHTHRPGPLAGRDEDWRAPRGPRLWNSGSWYLERALMGGQAHDSPYWPGTVLRVDDAGPPRVENALAGAELPA